MQPMQTQAARLLGFVREQGLIRSRDLALLSIDRKTLARAYRRGLVERCGRGTYQIPGSSADYRSCLVGACKRIPKGVVCLTSALWFHGLLSEQPKNVCIAVDRKARLPRIDQPPVRIVRFSGDALTQGVVNLALNGTAIRVYSPMKTVADCFKYRNKIGAEVSRVAINGSLAKNQYNRQKLLRFAEICRVKKIVVSAADEAERFIKSQSQPETARTWDFEVLRQEVWAEPLRVVARRYGVSDVALAKRCRKLGIPLPGRGYWSKMT